MLGAGMLSPSAGAFKALIAYNQKRIFDCSVDLEPEEVGNRQKSKGHSWRLLNLLNQRHPLSETPGKSCNSISAPAIGLIKAWLFSTSFRCERFRLRCKPPTQADRRTRPSHPPYNFHSFMHSKCEFPKLIKRRSEEFLLFFPPLRHNRGKKKKKLASQAA